jgi:hypothetical protein
MTVSLVIGPHTPELTRGGRRREEVDARWPAMLRSWWRQVDVAPDAWFAL